MYYIFELYDTGVNAQAMVSGPVSTPAVIGLMHPELLSDSCCSSSSRSDAVAAAMAQIKPDSFQPLAETALLPLSGAWVGRAGCCTLLGPQGAEPHMRMLHCRVGHTALSSPRADDCVAALYTCVRYQCPSKFVRSRCTSEPAPCHLFDRLL